MLRPFVFAKQNEVKRLGRLCYVTRAREAQDREEQRCWTGEIL